MLTTECSGAGGYSSGAAFADYDGDGDLDLYVARYIVWSPEKDLPCAMEAGGKKVPVYCRPIVYPPARGILYRNNGDGTFTDVSERSGIVHPNGYYGLTAIVSDFDDAEWPERRRLAGLFSSGACTGSARKVRSHR